MPRQTKEVIDTSEAGRPERRFELTPSALLYLARATRSTPSRRFRR